MTSKIPGSYAHFGHCRSWGTAIAVGTLIGQLTMAVMPQQAEAVQAENLYFARESVQLAEAAQTYRPIGTLFMNFTMKLAWLAAETDPELREQIQGYMTMYTRDFYGDRAGTDDGDLDWIRRHLGLAI